MKDYFDFPEAIPVHIKEVLAKYDNDDLFYQELKKMESELASLGWAFEWGLDAQPFNLRPIDDKATDHAWVLGNGEVKGYNII